MSKQSPHIQIFFALTRVIWRDFLWQYTVHHWNWLLICFFFFFFAVLVPGWSVRLQRSPSSNRLREFPSSLSRSQSSNQWPRTKRFTWMEVLPEAEAGNKAKGWAIHHPGQYTWRHMHILYINMAFSNTSTYTVCTQPVKLWDVLMAVDFLTLPSVSHWIINSQCEFLLLVLFIYIFISYCQRKASIWKDLILWPPANKKKSPTED